MKPIRGECTQLRHPEKRQSLEKRLSVLCGRQSLNTERTEHLRDLSVEALEARRSQRTSPHFFLQPFGQLVRLNGQITIMTTSGKWVAQGQPSYPLPPSTGN